MSTCAWVVVGALVWITLALLAWALVAGGTRRETPSPWDDEEGPRW